MASPTPSSPDSATFRERFEHIRSVVARVRTSYDSQPGDDPLASHDFIAAVWDQLEREGREALPPAPPPPPPASDVADRIWTLTAERGSRTLLDEDDDAAAGPSGAGDGAAPGPTVHDRVGEARRPREEGREEGGMAAAAGQERERATRVPTKYRAANEANFLPGEYGRRGPEWAQRRPWMTAEEEQAFFDGCSFYRCFRCSELGHTLANCDTGIARCMFCGRDHTTNNCRMKKPKCGSCGGMHVRGAAVCVDGEVDQLKEKYLVRYYSGQL